MDATAEASQQWFGQPFDIPKDTIHLEVSVARVSVGQSVYRNRDFGWSFVAPVLKVFDVCCADSPVRAFREVAGWNLPKINKPINMLSGTTNDFSGFCGGQFRVPSEQHYLVPVGKTIQCKSQQLVSSGAAMLPFASRNSTVTPCSTARRSLAVRASGCTVAAGRNVLVGIKSSRTG
jgi:hypothetical protein